MSTKTKQISGATFISFLILVLYSALFGYDLITLKKTFVLPDFFSYFFPYKHWFTENLSNGIIPLWNPYFGIGKIPTWFLTIPLDIYTIFEFLLGPQYHLIQFAQAFICLIVFFFALKHLDFSPAVAAAGSLLYFTSPWVSYFYYYFIKTNSFIGNFLIFVCVFQYYKTQNKKYLFGLFWAVSFSMFGTKAEYWFFNSIMFFFYCLLNLFLTQDSNVIKNLKKLLLLSTAFFFGILVHAWQLCILLPGMKLSDRAISSSWTHFFKPTMWKGLGLSIVESPFIQVFAVCSVVYLIIGKQTWRKNEIPWILAGILAILGGWNTSFVQTALIGNIFTKHLALSNTFPILIGIFIGILLERSTTPLDRLTLLRTLLKQLMLFAPLFLLLSWPGGILGDHSIDKLNPLGWKILLSVFSWIGCTQLHNNKLVKVSYLAILLVLFLRDQGTVILSYLTGQVWIQGRDGYLMDFFIVVIACVGLQSFRPQLEGFIHRSDHFQRLAKLINGYTPTFGGLAACLIIILSIAPNFHFGHWMIQSSPPDAPYFEGVPKIRQVISEIKTSPTHRIHIINKPTISHTFGFGSSILERVGQTQEYSSLVPSNYRNWGLYKHTGIKPEKPWGGYQGNNLINQKHLPKRETLGMSSWEAYHFQIMAGPSIDLQNLRLLGVKNVLIFNTSLHDPAIQYFHLKNKKHVDELVENIELTHTKTEGGMYYNSGNEIWIPENVIIGRIKNPLPRAFYLFNERPKAFNSLNKTWDPLISEDGTSIEVLSHKFSIETANIELYTPNKVKISLSNNKPAVLVLSDLHHPFWHASIDGKEVKIEPAFNILRSVKIPADAKTLEFFCKVPFLNYSLLLSITLLLLSVYIYFYVYTLPVFLESK